MPYPRPIAYVASRISTTENELRDFATRGWISTKEENGNVFVSGRHEYKARFILHLRHRLGLTNEEIARVLDVQEAPYSLKDVPAILGRKLM